jgi:CubicO group peptidase (beta-lactamase class C family)
MLQYMPLKIAVAIVDLQGTDVWVDPQYDLIYVFLSNRTFPDVIIGKKYTHEDPRCGVRGYYEPARRYIKSCYATSAIGYPSHNPMVNAQMHKPRNTYFWHSLSSSKL